MGAVLIGGVGILLLLWVMLIVVEAQVGYRILWSHARVRLDEWCLSGTRFFDRWHIASWRWSERQLGREEGAFGNRWRERWQRYVSWVHFRRPRQLELQFTPSGRWEAMQQHKEATKLSPAKRRRLRKL